MSEAILAAIDEEIERLTKVRSLLTESGRTTLHASLAGAKRGRKPGAKKAAKKAAKRVLSPEARGRIVAAQKRRWAAAKKASK